MISPAMLSSAVAELLALPRLDWREDGESGVTGIATGTDEQIRRTVWEWALAFGLKPTAVAPVRVPTAWTSYTSPGWIYVEVPILGTGVTVGGRLVDPEAGK